MSGDYWKSTVHRGRNPFLPERLLYWHIRAVSSEYGCMICNFNTILQRWPFRTMTEVSLM